MVLLGFFWWNLLSLQMFLPKIVRNTEYSVTCILVFLLNTEDYEQLVEDIVRDGRLYASENHQEILKVSVHCNSFMASFRKSDLLVWMPRSNEIRRHTVYKGVISSCFFLCHLSAVTNLSIIFATSKFKGGMDNTYTCLIFCNLMHI